MKKWMPSASDVVRESLIVLGGALLAALIIGQVPSLKEWIKANWQDPVK